MLVRDLAMVGPPALLLVMAFCHLGSELALNEYEVFPAWAGFVIVLTESSTVVFCHLLIVLVLYLLRRLGCLCFWPCLRPEHDEPIVFEYQLDGCLERWLQAAALFVQERISIEIMASYAVGLGLVLLVNGIYQVWSFVLALLLTLSTIGLIAYGRSRWYFRSEVDLSRDRYNDQDIIVQLDPVVVSSNIEVQS
jgi:hypothetical protein